jgi:nucleoside-diphosphate-sugar epimerase
LELIIWEWAEDNMQTVVITGINGFIGSHIAKKFQTQGYKVLGLDIANEPSLLLLEMVNTDQNFAYFQIDITKNIASLNELISKSDIVIHLAAIVGIKNYLLEPLKLFETNVIGSANVIRGCATYKKRLVFSSTSEIFGKNPDTPWDEDADRVLGSTEKDRWGYSTSKATIEHLLHSLKSQLDYRIVRYFNVYGPGQSPIFLVSRNIHRILNSLPLEVFDGGLQTRCLTYIDDAVEGTYLLATRETLNHSVYNLGSQKENTIAEILDMVNKLNGGSSMENIDTAISYGSSYEDLLRRVPSTKRIADELNWVATTSAEQGIGKFYDWAEASSWWRK